MTTHPAHPRPVQSNLPERGALSGDQVSAARTLAVVMIRGATDADADFQLGDLVLKHFLSNDGRTDLLCILGDRDCLDRLVAVARGMGEGETAWREVSNDGAR